MGDFEIVNGILTDYRGDDDVVVVPNNVTEIGESAFGYLEKGVCKVVLPSGLKVIGGNAFAECLNLQEINIPDTVEKIDIEAFYNDNMKEITIPRSVKYIGFVAFGGCMFLEKLYYNGTVLEWNKIEIDRKIINTSTKTHTVICTDGTVELNPY